MSSTYFTAEVAQGEDLALSDEGTFVPVHEYLQRRAILRKQKPGIKIGPRLDYDALRWPIVRKDNLVGCSDTTVEKCEEAAAIFRRCVAISDNVARKYGVPKLMLDCNSGPGGFVWEPDYGNRYSRIVIRGTPLRELQALNHSRFLDTWHVAFIDLQAEYCTDLQRRIDEGRRASLRLPRDMEVLCGDNAALAPDWVSRSVSRFERPTGVMVHDANNGVSSELLDGLGRLPQLQRVDFLIYVPAAKMKWHHRQGIAPQSLEEILMLARKKRWLLGPLRDHWQHLWMMGVNWDGYPDYRRLGFVWWDSPEGQERWRRIMTTVAERKAS